MSNLYSDNTQEIDLIKMLIKFWHNKLTITLFTILSFLVVFTYQKIFPNKNFTAKTKITQISTDEYQKYILFNNFLNEINTLNEKEKLTEGVLLQKNNNFFELTRAKISSTKLLNLFIEQIREGNLFKKAIIKYNLISRDKFENQEDYEEALVKMSSEIKITSVEDDFKEIKSYLLSFQYNDYDKWKKALKFLIDETNNSVKNILSNRIQTTISIAKGMKNLKIKTLNKAIESEIINYEIRSKSKLALLNEQAIIARKLKIKEPISENKIINQNYLKITLDGEFPIYTRGYDAIETEINLLKKRSIKKEFIPSVVKLETKLRFIENNERIEDFEKVFKNTPLVNGNFLAASIKVLSTEVKYHSKNIIFLFLAVIIGGLIGVLFVVLRDSLKNYNRLN